jgi:hypothetical protein
MFKTWDILLDYMQIYMLIVGIILCLLGLLMLLGQLNFLIKRYEWFHNAIRKQKISVKRLALSKYYAILFFIAGIPLMIGGIIGFINPDNFKLFSIWLYITIAVIGVLGILYCNISNRFIKPLEDTTE